jgi:acetamidase/formamidase
MLTVSRSCLLLFAGLTAVHAVDLPLSAANVHWGFFSKTLEPALTVDSGTEVKVEMATHHGCDDYDKVSSPTDPVNGITSTHLTHFTPPSVSI